MIGYYHIAAMGHWREVVMEQMRVLSRVFKGPLRIGLLAEQWEDGYVHGVMRTFGIQYEIIHYAAGFDQFEFPTLARLHGDCRADPGIDRVFYLHTKGVSRPAEWKWQQWRWLMNRSLVEAIARAPDDVVRIDCANWCDSHKGYPYAEGNFWLASAELVRTLPDLVEFSHRMVRDPAAPQWGGRRYACELWLGQAMPATREIRADFRNAGLWTDDFWTARMDLCEELMRFHAL